MSGLLTSPKKSGEGLDDAGPAPVTPSEAAGPNGTESPESAIRRWRKALRASASKADVLTATLIVMAMIVGGALRLYDIGDLPRGFNQDEAVYSYDAWSLTRTGRDHLGHPFNFVAFETYGDWTPPLQTILLTPVAAIAGLDITAMRSWNALLALLVLPLLYVLGMSLFSNRVTSLVAVWIVALLPWHITQSRWIIPAAIVPVLTVLLMIALVRAARFRSGAWMIGIALAGAACLATYQSLRGFVPILMIIAGLIWWRRYLSAGIRWIAGSALIFALFALPTFGFLLLDEAGGMRMDNVSVFNDESPYLEEGETVDTLFLVNQYLDYYGPSFLLEEGGEYYPWVLPRDVGLLPLAVVVAVVAGLLALVIRSVRPRSEWERGVSLFLLAGLALYALPGAISLPGPAAPRVIHGLPIIALIAAYGIVETGTALSRWRPKQWPVAGRTILIASGAALALLFVGQSAQHMEAYFSKYGDETSFDFHYGFNEAMDFAYRNRNLYDQVLVFHVNEPYIYVLFDQEIAPDDARARMTVERTDGGFNWITNFDNIYFSARNWVDPPEEIPVADMDVVFQTFEEDGTVAYEVRTGEVEGRGLVMLIYKPSFFDV